MQDSTDIQNAQITKTRFYVILPKITDKILGYRKIGEKKKAIQACFSLEFVKNNSVGGPPNMSHFTG